MAATAGAIRAGRAYVELYSEDSKLHQGLRRAESRLKAFGASITKVGALATAAGAAIAAPFIAAVKSFVTAGSALKDMSDRTGVAVEALASLKFAAEQSGSSLEALEAALRTMAKITDKASEEGKAAVETFDRLGVSVDDILSKTPEERFRTLAEALSKVADPGERAALAMKVFGKSGTELIPLLAHGRAGIEALEQQARELGLVMSAEDAAAAEALGDALDQLKASVMGTFNSIGASLAPELQALADRLSEIGPRVGKWIENNREAVVTIAKLAVGLVAVGGTLAAFGQAMSLAGTAVGGLSTALKLAQANAATLGPALLALGLAAVAVQALKASEGMQAFGDALERVRDLTAQMNAQRAQEHAGTLEQARGIADPEARKKFLEEELNRARLNIEGINAQRAGSQQRLDSARMPRGGGFDVGGFRVQTGIEAIPTIQDMFGFNTEADIARAEIEQQDAAAQATRTLIDELEKAIKEADMAPDAPADVPSKSEAAPAAPIARTGIGSGTGLLKPTDWDKAVQDLQAGMFAALGAASGFGGGIAPMKPIDLDSRLPETGSVASFSANTRQFDAGGGIPGKQLEKLTAMDEKLSAIADNTKEGNGIEVA